MDNYKFIEEKFSKLSATEQLDYALIVAFCALEGTFRTHLKTFFKVNLIGELDVMTVVQKAIREEFISVHYEHNTYKYSIQSFELLVFSLHLLQEESKNNSKLERVVAKLKEKLYMPDTYSWRKAESNLQHCIGNIILTNSKDVRQRYIKGLAEYSDYRDDFFISKYEALIKLLLYWKAKAFVLQLDIDSIDLMAQMVVETMNKGQVAVPEVSDIADFLLKETKDEQLQVYFDIHLVHAKGDVERLKELMEEYPELAGKSINIISLLQLKDFESVLPLMLNQAGIDNIDKHKSKKTSKFWNLLGMQEELFFPSIVLKKFFDVGDFLRNRYRYFAKDYSNDFFHLHIYMVDTYLLLKNGNDSECGSTKKDLVEYFYRSISFYHQTVPVLHLAYACWLYAVAFGNDKKNKPVPGFICNLLSDKAWDLSINGYKWHASLLAEAYMEATFDDTPKAGIETLINRDLLQFKDLIKVQAIKSDWELTLLRMSQLADNFQGKYKDKSEKKEENRLVWVVGDRMSVIAKEQRLLKSGAWSKPKAVSDARLMDKKVKGATKEDLEILNNAFSHIGYYYDYEPLEVWKRLAGMPNVVLESDHNVAVTVEEAQFELVVRQKKNQYHVNFDDGVDITFPVKKETPTRYIYYKVDDKAKEWYRMFPSGVTLPLKAKDELIKIVGQLGQTLTVHSMVDEIKDGLPEIEADNQVHALLTPKGVNIVLNLYMKPFTSQPPYVVPTQGKEMVVDFIDNVRTRAVRNFKEERKIMKAFLKDRPYLENMNEGEFEWELTNQYDALEVLDELQSGKVEPVIEWPKGVKFELLGKASAVDFDLNIKKKKDWFAVDGELKIDEDTVLSLQSLLEELKKNPNSNYIEVSKSKFIALTEKLRKQLDTLNSLVEEDKDGFSLHKMASYGALGELSKEANTKTDKAWRDFEKSVEKANKSRYRVPSTLDASLRDYQEEGFKWMSRLMAWGAGACLADDMGLGKTLQGIALMLSHASKGASLVVAPSSVTFNWIKEVQKFAPTLKVHLLYKAEDRKKLIDGVGAFDLIVASYGLMQSSADIMTAKEWNVVLLDEAQAIKNKTTKRSQVAMQLQANYRVLTTGTPIENNLSELWNLFQFINPGLLGSWTKFQENFIMPIEGSEREDSMVKRKALKKLVAPFILRRRKNEVLDELPQKTEITLSVDLSDDERNYYEALRRTAVEEIQEALDEEAQNRSLQVLAEITKLRRACCHPSLVNNNLQIPSTKLKLFLETVQELRAGGHRALVFSQFVGFLSILKETLEAEDISYQYLDGKTPLKQREKAVNAFQEGKGELFLISLKAGGTGLNLTGADYVIHMDPWWNPAVEDQATDRAHRIGQTRPVTVYRFVTKHTIEEKMIALHSEKRELADDLLSGTSKATKLNAKELMKLLQDNRE